MKSAVELLCSVWIVTNEGSKVFFGPGTQRVSHVVGLPRAKTIIPGRKAFVTHRHIILSVSQQVLNLPVLLLVMLLQHLQVHCHLVNRRPQPFIVDPQTMVVPLQLVVVSHHHPQLLLNAVQPHHPLFVDDWAVDVDWHFVRHFVRHRDLDLLLYDFLYWVVNVDWLVHVDRLLDVYWLLYLYVHWLFDYLWRACYLHLHRHFPLHLYDLLYYSLWALNVLRHLYSHLHWLFNHDFLYRFFGSPSILVFQLFFQNLHFFFQLILVALQSVDEPVMVAALFVSFS